MTKMKRISVAFPDELDKGIFELRKHNEYIKCSYSEIIRRLVKIGLKAETHKGKPKEAGLYDTGEQKEAG